MTLNIIQSLFSAISRIGAAPGDSDDVRLEKTMLVAVSLMVSSLGVLWSFIYLAFGERMAAAIPLSYSTFSLLSVVIFYETRGYAFFRSSQLVLILVLPFALMLVLGGFINSSAVILWSLLSPLGALVFAGRRTATGWFVAYLGLVIVSGFTQRFVRVSNNLTPALVQIFFVLNIIGVSTIAFTVLNFFVGEKATAFNRLSIEQEKSEGLLHNILPEDVADVLKEQGGVIARHYDHASILFADIVGFTPLSAKLAPEETVDLLNQVFSHFDALAEQYGLEKIRTIGDNYMVAAGVPRPRPDHAQAIARMALDMRAYVAHHPGIAGHSLGMRFGMNSGPVVAGVIGRKKFQYDVWGDVVNTASRMQTHTEGGQIQVTRDAYEILRDEFVLEPRGKVSVKGKGEMETWYLVAERESPGQDVPAGNDD